MKTKNISFAEKHTEKIVVLVAVLFLAAVVALYVLGGSITVDLRGQAVPVSELEDVLASSAQRLERELEGGSKLPDIATPDVEARFVSTLKRPATPGGTDGADGNRFVALNSGTGLEIGGVTPGGFGLKPYRVVTVPAPTDVAARAGQGTLDPTGVQGDLVKLVGSRPPFDLAWVAVAGRFPIKQIEEQLAAESTPDVLAVPESWWSTQLELADVELWRQEKTGPGPDDWSKPTMVAAMPGRANLRAVLNSGRISPENMPKLIGALRKNRTALIRPVFYGMKAGTNGWSPPEVPGLEVTAPTEVEYSPQVRRLIEQRDALIEKIKIQKDRAQSFVDRGRPVPTSVKRFISKYQDELRDIAKQINVELGGDEGPGGDAGDDRFGPTRPGGGATFDGIDEGILDPVDEDTDKPAPGTERKKIVRLWSDPEPVVWANDLMVEPGKTYRYRMRVVFTNPLFGKRVPDSQADDAKRPLLVGAWSDWTEPVATPQRLYYFLVKDNRRDHTGTVEVWKFNDGGWRKASFTVGAGDTIGNETAQHEPLQPQAVETAEAAEDKPEISFDTGLIAVDLDQAHAVSTTGNRTTSRLIALDGNALVHLVRADDEARKEQLLNELTKPVLEFDPRLLDEIRDGTSSPVGGPGRPGGPIGPVFEGYDPSDDYDIYQQP